MIFNDVLMPSQQESTTKQGLFFKGGHHRFLQFIHGAPTYILGGGAAISPIVSWR